MPKRPQGEFHVANVLERVLRVGEGRLLRRLERYAHAVGQLEDDFKELTDDELKNETQELRERYSNGESLDDLLPEAFAAVRERSEEHTSELQSLMRISYAVFCLKKTTDK